MTRPPSTRKPPSAQPAQLGQTSVAQLSVAEAAPQSQSESVRKYLEEGMSQVQQQFHAMLRGDASLSTEQREQMEHFLQQVLEDTAGSSEPIPEEVFDPAVWRETVDTLRRSGGIAEGEADHLIRSINDALAPLQRRESQLAIEFSRRMATDGEEKAIEWLRKQTETEAAQKAKDTAPAPQGEYAPLRNEVINSRSRRLRGPPGR